MIIKIKKFGLILLSRPMGKEALFAFQPVLKSAKSKSKIVVDFEGIVSLSPSWGDEFLTPLVKQYGKKVIFKNTANPSVKATLEILGIIHEQ